MRLLFMLEFALSDLTCEHSEFSVVEFAFVGVQNAILVLSVLVSVLCIDVRGNIDTDNSTSLILWVTKV